MTNRCPGLLAMAVALVAAITAGERADLVAFLNAL
jgi:hypothetical protein